MMDAMTSAIPTHGPSQSVSPAAATFDHAASTRAARDRRLAAVLSDGSLVWLLDERYDAAHDTWTVDLLRADPMYGWRRQRYIYDTAVDALYFWGEHPVPEAEVRVLNRRVLPRFCAVASPACVNHKPDSAPDSPAHGGNHSFATND